MSVSTAMKTAARLWAAGAICTGLAAAGCGSATGPSVPLTLGGVWSGIIGEGSGGGRALRVTWVATQNGNDVRGPVTISTSPAITDTTFSGTLAGTLAGEQIVLSMSATPQALSDCALSGAGAATAGANTIAGDLTVVFMSCGSLDPPASAHFTFTRNQGTGIRIQAIVIPDS